MKNHDSTPALVKAFITGMVTSLVVIIKGVVTDMHLPGGLATAHDRWVILSISVLLCVATGLGLGFYAERSHIPWSWLKIIGCYLVLLVLINVVAALLLMGVVAFVG